MDIHLILGLLGGLALFLYGMQMMSTGLEAAAGDRLKTILEKLTSNRFAGVLMGAFITAIIQSSSATTVMVVGFVNAKLMTLNQAVWVIMGANIGTTITGILIGLDIGMIAPLFAFVGVSLVVFVKNPKLGHYGQIIAGLGILFIGMDFMSVAMSPLRDSQAFINIISTFSNPLIGILVGALFTALIQSSSASVGILQALAFSGVIGLDNAVYILFGQNIGTCITAVLASIGTNQEAKRTTIIHLSFNIIGTILFTIICMFTPLTSFVSNLAIDNPSLQIAYMHTIFNIVTTLILLPFGNYLAKFAQKILPSDPNTTKPKSLLKYLKPLPNSNKLFGGSYINIELLHKEIMHMSKLAYENVYDSIDQLLNFSNERHETILNKEDDVDYLNQEIAEYISNILSDTTLNHNISSTLSSYYLMLVDIERLSDYAINIEKQAKLHLQEKLTDNEIFIINKIKSSTMKMQTMNFDVTSSQIYDQKIHNNSQIWRDELSELLASKELNAHVTIMLSRILTDYERINDHALNIAQELIKINNYLHDNYLNQIVK